MIEAKPDAVLVAGLGQRFEQVLLVGSGADVPSGLRGVPEAESIVMLGGADDI